MIALVLAAAVAAPVPPVVPVLAAPAVHVTADDERATEWPKAGDSAALKRSVSKLRKAANEEMEAAGRAEIEAAGAAAAPFLLRSLGKEKNADTRARFVEALDTVTTAAHTRLLAEHFEEKSPAVRHYALRRVAVLGDPGLRETAEALHADLIARRDDPKSRKKVDPADVDLASVLCVATGSTTGLPRVLELADPDEWVEWRETLRPVCSCGRAAGDELGKAVAKALGSADKARERVAALHLLAYAGDESLARHVRPSLDAEENQVKVAAINALRMMVDGDPPIDKLSTFDAIERANRWKGRI